jgi:7-cyano-7-deazaguanine synthase in queuosine biosynthesis
MLELMPCMHFLMQQGYCLCMNNFNRINTPNGTVTYRGTVGMVPFRINAVSSPIQNSWSCYISGTQSGQYEDEVCSSLESNTL